MAGTWVKAGHGPGVRYALTKGSTGGRHDRPTGASMLQLIVPRHQDDRAPDPGGDLGWWRCRRPGRGHTPQLRRPPRPSRRAAGPERAWPGPCGMRQGGYSDRRWAIHQVIAEGDTVVLALHLLMAATPGRSWAWPRPAGPGLRPGPLAPLPGRPGHRALGGRLTSWTWRASSAAIPGPPSQPVLADALAQLLAELHPNRPPSSERARQAGADQQAAGSGGTDGRGPHSASVHRPCGPMGQPPGRVPGRPRHRRPAARGGRGRARVQRDRVCR